ncbi:MAG: hypothetical protein GY851_28505 [bacterium]|nr:hypothetical protein [bacterium]
MKALAMSIAAGLLTTGSARAAEAEQQSTWTTDYRFGGCGGLYLLADPGDLWIDIEKSDLNRAGRTTYLRAILFGPDRRVIDEQLIPDVPGKGEPGPVQRIRFATTVTQPGVYGVNVTVSTDRYGQDIAWGFRTNCKHYLIETSRGHRDARHEEPLVLLNPDVAGEICFMPRDAAIELNVTNMPKGVGTLTVVDATGNELATLAVSDKGEAAHAFAAGAREHTPWRLRLPKFQAVVHIDGVTRWTKEEPFDALSLWTPNAESWFPFHGNRWLLTPYSRTVYGEPGMEGTAQFRLHNNGPAEKRVKLALMFLGRLVGDDPAKEPVEFVTEIPTHVPWVDPPWPVSLSADTVTLKPGKAADITLSYRVPDEGDQWVCRVRAAADDGFQTYATFELRRGEAPAEQPLSIPHLLKPYDHENARLGYAPAYPLANEMYFDAENRPAVSAKNGIHVLRAGGWEERTQAALPDGKEIPFSPAMSKVAFDRDNGVYTIGHWRGIPGFIYSTDGGATFAASPIPGNGGFDIEQFSGHNLPDGPPPFVRVVRTAKDPKLMWRSLNDLALFVPEKKTDGTIVVGEPVLLTKKCIGFSTHSGIPSSVVSRGSRVHVAWGEATEPDAKAPGVPTYVATYDRETGEVSEPALVGYGPPANDVHNTPCITMDSKGYLHVLVGTHGRAFRYARSLEPNDAAGGWTESKELGPGLRQTYVGLVCDQDDALHVVFRLWFSDDTYFPAGTYATLSYMSKRPGEPWTNPRPLVVAAFTDYSIFYHRLTIDRAGRLFLSYDYWSTYWFYRTDHVGTRRALMMSPDGGDTWKLAGSDDIAVK